MILRDDAPSSPTRRDLLRAAVACGVTAALPVGLALPATAAPAASSPGGFFLGADGRLHAAGAGTTGAVSATAVGSPGGHVAAVQRTDGGVAVFTIGSHGGLVAGFSSEGGAGMGFVRHPQGGLAAPGGRIAAVEGQTGTHVHVTGSNGSIYHAMYSRSGAVTVAPAPLVAPGTVLPATSLAAFRVGDRFGVVFVGADGSVQTSVGRSGMGPAGPIAIWTTSAATPAGTAAPGSPVATASTGTSTTAFFTGTDGRLWRIPYSGTAAQQPVALSSQGAVPAGAHLAATAGQVGEFAVTYVGAGGAVMAATNVFGPRPDPYVISPAGVHLPGNPVALCYGGDDYLYIGWCGVDLWRWLRWWWRRPFPPPPPPDPYFELIDLQTTIPTRPSFDVDIVLSGLTGRR